MLLLYFIFWAILFIVLVFISILFHVSRDYRNWILPFIAFIAVGIIFTLFSIMYDLNATAFITNGVTTNFEIDYFTNNYQNIAFSIYATIALFFIISMVLSLPNRPLLLNASFKKIITTFIIGAILFVISPNKSSDLLLFTFAPLAIMATSHIELKQLKLKQEMVLFVLIICSLFAFFSQL